MYIDIQIGNEIAENKSTGSQSWLYTNGKVCKTIKIFIFISIMIVNFEFPVDTAIRRVEIRLICAVQKV